MGDRIDDLVDWQLSQRPANVWWTCPTCRTGWLADEEIQCCGVKPVRTPKTAAEPGSAKGMWRQMIEDLVWMWRYFVREFRIQLTVRT